MLLFKKCYLFQTIFISIYFIWYWHPFLKVFSLHFGIFESTGLLAVTKFSGFDGAKFDVNYCHWEFHPQYTIVHFRHAVAGYTHSDSKPYHDRWGGRCMYGDLQCTAHLKNQLFHVLPTSNTIDIFAQTLKSTCSQSDVSNYTKFFSSWWRLEWRQGRHHHFSINLCHEKMTR